MSKVLLEAILDDGIRQPKFFNGRLLSGEDLTAQQLANRLANERLGRALGDGVAFGFEVSDPGTGTVAAPLVWVEPGVAVNRLGQVLRLSVRIELALASQSSSFGTADDDGTGLFGECDRPGEGTYVAGTGVYLLLVAPASGTQGRALVSGLGNRLTRCNVGYVVDGVCFRVVKLDLPAAQLNDTPHLRSRAAYTCFGIEALDDVSEHPFGPPLDAYGAVDALRAVGAVTDCDVPLAVLAWSAETGIGFVDLWSVRRRIIDPRMTDTWQPLIGDRRAAEADAALRQFQEHLRSIQLHDTVLKRRAAEDRFVFLPPAGYLPVGDGAFDWHVFLGPMAPPAETRVDEALLRAIVHEALYRAPIVITPFAESLKPKLAPPTPVSVYRVPEHEDFVVFARSAFGRLRVFLQPTPTADQATDVRAARQDGNAESAASRADGDVFVVSTLAPGHHTVRVAADEFVEPEPVDADIVGGRTTDVVIALQPLPNGRLIISVVDANGKAIGESVSAVSASSGGAAVNAELTSGDWLLAALPDGSYDVTVTAPHYLTGRLSGVAIKRGQVVHRTIPLTAARRDKPPLCIGVANLRMPPLLKGRICLVFTEKSLREQSIYRVEKQALQIEAVAEEDTSEKVVVRLRKEQRALEFADAETRRRRGVQSFFDVGFRDLMPELQRQIDPSRFIDIPWLGMEQMEPLSDAVREWLAAWKAYLAEEQPTAKLGKASPVIYVDPHWKVPSRGSEIFRSPYAYAVFGEFYVPVSITPSTHIIPIPVPLDERQIVGLPDWHIRALQDNQIRFVDQLPTLWGEAVEDILGETPEVADSIILDAGARVLEINQTREYLRGVTADQRDAMKNSGIADDVALANADRDALKAALAAGAGGAAGKDFGPLAERLISQARAVVPRQTWQLNGLDLTDDEVGKLHTQGVDSQGALRAVIAKGDRLAAVASNTGIDAARLSDRQGAIVENLALASLQMAPRAEVTSIGGVDATLARTMAAQGFDSTEKLATANAKDLSTKAGISEARASEIITNAGHSALSAQPASLLAPVAGHGDVTIGTLSALGSANEAAAKLNVNVAEATGLLNALNRFQVR